MVSLVSIDQSLSRGLLGNGMVLSSMLYHRLMIIIML